MNSFRVRLCNQEYIIADCELINLQYLNNVLSVDPLKLNYKNTCYIIKVTHKDLISIKISSRCRP